ncbi:hypothetical protein ACHAXA_001327 [Cyclostephanos tholiformis]|jgi:hypothetical protein|uniref:Uncharacterized protein n=1 Tax=Cyclostephanos tholiformis TaxID=382380 RepID=A0ABD3RGF3_9STRA
MMNRLASSCSALPRRLRHNHLALRPISITPPLALPLPAKKTSPEEPKTAQKKVNKEKKGPSTAKLEKMDSAEKRITDLLIKAYDAPSLVPPPASAEEMAQRYNVGRNYVIGCFRRHNELNHDLAVKIRMKKYALRMMPREGIDLGDVTTTSSDGRSVYGKWKAEALKVNDSWGPPDHRHVPMYTPPIEGFDISQYMNMGDEDN